MWVAAQLIAALQAAAARGQPFDVAILDQQMPGISGADLARRIRAMPDVGPTKLILPGSVGRPNLRNEARKVGIDAFVTKPLSRLALIAAICQIFEIAGAVPAADRQSGMPERTPAAGKSLRVLVAEDNKINQMIVREVIEGIGHQVSVAANGHEAVATALAGDYDLILMDLQMPGMGGVEATAAIRQTGGRRGQIPIIACTAHAMPEVRAEILAAGMQDLVTKPINPQELAATIRLWTGGRDSRADSI
jgi:CheY-like chemotaxis protein